MVNIFTLASLSKGYIYQVLSTLFAIIKLIKNKNLNGKWKADPKQGDL